MGRARRGGTSSERNVEGARSGSCPQGGLRPSIRWFHDRKQLSYPMRPPPACIVFSARSSLLANPAQSHVVCMTLWIVRSYVHHPGPKQKEGEGVQFRFLVAWDCGSRSRMLSFSLSFAIGTIVRAKKPPLMRCLKRNSRRGTIKSNDS